MGRPIDAGEATSWRSYLDSFHHEHPGITESILERCVDDAGTTPYHWIAAAIGGSPDRSGSDHQWAGPTVLDLACGSGPMRRLVTGTWVGTDRAPAELGVARARGAHPLVLGDAVDLPFARASFDVVICSMALMITQPLDRVLAEITRLLRPNGRLVALLPANRPLRSGDLVHVASLLLTLRRTRLAYPNDRALTHLPNLLDPAGLALVDDRRRRFEYSMATVDAAHDLVRSLYLPGVDPDRIAAADRRSERWVGQTFGVPLRRVVAQRVPTL